MESTWTGRTKETAPLGRWAQLPGHLALLLAVAALVFVAATRTASETPVYGGGVFPAIDPAEQARDAARVPVLPEGFVGARITSSVTQVAPEGGLVFDTVRWDSGGWWNPAEPTRLTFPVSGICSVTAQITILGSAYGGALADTVVLSVKRDGDPSAFVAFARYSNQDPAPAGGINASTTDWFEAGEYLEVFVTPGLMVEANWPGRSNVSPVLVVTC